MSFERLYNIALNSCWTFKHYELIQIPSMQNRIFFCTDLIVKIHPIFPLQFSHRTNVYTIFYLLYGKQTQNATNIRQSKADFDRPECRTDRKSTNRFIKVAQWKDAAKCSLAFEGTHYIHRYKYVTWWVWLSCVSYIDIWTRKARS